MRACACVCIYIYIKKNIKEGKEGEATGTWPSLGPSRCGDVAPLDSPHVSAGSIPWSVFRLRFLSFPVGGTRRARAQAGGEGALSAYPLKRLFHVAAPSACGAHCRRGQGHPALSPCAAGDGEGRREGCRGRVAEQERRIFETGQESLGEAASGHRQRVQRGCCPR